MSSEELTGIDHLGNPESIDSRHIELSDSFMIGRHLMYVYFAANHKYPLGDGDSDKILTALDRVATVLSSKEIDSSVAGKIRQVEIELEQNYDPDESLNEEDAINLERSVNTWINLLEEDLREEQRIPAAEIGAMDVNKLLNSPESLFDPPVWNWMHSRPRSDISEACKTIVVGSPTASVMLSLRAAEHCLRVWYEEETNDSIQAGWGRVLEKLIDEFLDDEVTNQTLQQQLSEVPLVLSNLYYLKEKRNQVNHPEKSPDETEARQTLMFVVGTITEIYNEIVDEVLIVQNGTEISYDRGGQDEERVILEIIESLDDGDGADKSDVHEAAQQAGFNRYEVSELIDDILMSGQAYEPAKGSLKAI